MRTSLPLPRRGAALLTPSHGGCLPAAAGNRAKLAPVGCDVAIARRSGRASAAARRFAAAIGPRPNSPAPAAKRSAVPAAPPAETPPTFIAGPRFAC